MQLQTEQLKRSASMGKFKDFHYLLILINVFLRTSQFGVVSNSNVVKIMNVEADKSNKEVYQNSDAKNIIRAFSWNNAKPNSFYVVGYDSYSKHITF